MLHRAELNQSLERLISERLVPDESAFVLEDKLVQYYYRHHIELGMGPQELDDLQPFDIRAQLRKIAKDHGIHLKTQTYDHTNEIDVIYCDVRLKKGKIAA